MPPPPSPPAYHIVELKVSDDVSVKVALNKSNLYVVGYCDQFEGNYRAHFLNDAPLNAINDQFKEAKTPFVSLFTTVLDMKQLKKKTGINRRKAGLGIGKWKNSITAINNQEIDEKKEAIFLLLSVQMISEAARFKYIEQKLIQNLQGFTPDYKVLNLENNWLAITKAITDSKDGKFKSPITLRDASDKPWKVDTVEEIAPDMGLLCYYLGSESIVL